MNEAKRQYLKMSEAQYQKKLRQRRLKRAAETPEEKEARRKKFREYQREYRKRQKTRAVTTQFEGSQSRQLTKKTLKKKRLAALNGLNVIVKMAEGNEGRKRTETASARSLL